MQKHAVFRTLTWLSLSNASLPNNTIRKNWYTGRKPLKYLFFILVPICCIQSEAFDEGAFQSLTILKFLQNPIHIVNSDQRNTLIGLKLLNELYIIEDTNPTVFPVDFLLPARLELKRFEHNGHLLSHASLTNLFGQKPMRLLHIEIYCNGIAGQTNFIAAENFTGLKLIQILSINACALESIRRGTFDKIGKTLMRLYLGDNRMTHIDSEVFWPFLDALPAIWTYMKGRCFIFINAMCDKASMKTMMHLDNMTRISFKHSDDQDIKCWSTTADAMETHDDDNDDDSLSYQSLDYRVNKWVKPQFFYKIPKFQLHFRPDSHELVVVPATETPYRVLIRRIDRTLERDQQPRCPITIEDDSDPQIQCWSSRVRAAVIPIVCEGCIVSACLILVPSAWKQAIPLHCVTIHRPAQNNQLLWGIELGIVAIFGICSLSAMIWTLIGISSYKYHPDVSSAQ